MVATTPLESRPTAGFLFDTQTVLQTDALAIGYGGKPARVVAGNIHLTLKAGELVCLIGPNGAGKSTLIRTLAGMQAPLSGQVRLLGEDVHKLPTKRLAQTLSVVLTERINPGLLTARTLVGLGRHPYTDWSGRLTAQDEAIVSQAIAAVGANALAERQMGELSDGERQKIMIARALAQQPALMILDEPTAFLDLPRRVEIMQLLRQLAHDEARAILLSTHDLDLALRTADRIWLLTSDGVLHAGAPEDLVLNGAFEQAFAAEGVAFDAASGTFRVNAGAKGKVAVVGDGLPALWTKRALERAGFSTADAGQAIACVEAHEGRWTLSHGSGLQAFTSLEALIEAVKRL
jgi:iron complex transport system ATP-binding protein